MKQKVLSVLLTLALLLGLTACGGSALARDTTSSVVGNYYEAAAEEAGGVMGSSGESSSTALPENRKWIITVYLTAEAEDLDSALAAIDQQITDMAGYVQEQSVYNGSAYSGSRYRNADLTIRIPAEDVDAFTGAVSGIANVIRREKDLEDITLQYVATESRVQALETEEARLLELLEQAETMADLLEIESRLTEVRYELESVTSQMRIYNDQVEFATIHLSLSEVQEYTPVEEPTLWERIRDGFLNSLKGVKEGAVDLFVWVITMSPYLVVLTALIWLIRPLLKKLSIRRKAKKEKKGQQE